MVSRVTSTTSAAAAVLLEEWSARGSLIQTIHLPVADAAGGGYACTQSGSATSEGYGSTSPNGQWLTLPCYDAAQGTASVATTGNAGHVVARVGPDGRVSTTARFTDNFVGSSVRGAAVEDNGAVAWASGASGVVALDLPAGANSTLVYGGNTRNVALYTHGGLGLVLMAGAATSLTYVAAAAALNGTASLTAVVTGLTALDSQVRGDREETIRPWLST